MKSLNFFKFLFAFVAFSLFLTSCGDDTSIIDPDKDPILEIVAVNGFVSSDTTLRVGQDFTVQLKAVKTDNDLKIITIQENGVKIELSSDRLSNEIVANPFTVAAGGFEKFIFAIRAHADASTKTYTFILEDVKGNKSTKFFAISTVAFTDATTIPGVLFNQGGLPGTGGLDLDNGVGTASTDASAELRDEGIDVSLPLPSNWLQQISGINTTEVKYIKKGTNGIAENFSFDAIKYKEEIVGLWGNGTAFTATIGAKSVSNKVVIGDIFIAKKGDNYYLLNVADVRIVTNGNTDSYVFDIKK